MVASRKESINMLVTHGWDALCAALGNSNEIAATLERLHWDRKLLSEIIRNGAETGKRFILKSAL